MRKSIFSLLMVSSPRQFLLGGLPLIRFEDFLPFTYLCCPACPVEDDFGLGSNQRVFPAAFMFLEEPCKIPKPHVSGDVVDVSEQAGVLVVFRPPFHDCIQGGQPAVFIHPSPSTGSQVFQFPLDSLLALCCRSEVYPPFTFRFASLDMESKKVETIVDVGENCFLFGQFQVELDFEEVTNFLLGLLYSGDTVITQYNEIIRITDETIVAVSCLPPLSAFILGEVPLCCCPLIKLVQVDIG